MRRYLKSSVIPDIPVDCMEWLGSRDSNPDSMIQSHVSYLVDLSPRSLQMEKKWKK